MSSAWSGESDTYLYDISGTSNKMGGMECFIRGLKHIFGSEAYFQTGPTGRLRDGVLLTSMLHVRYNVAVGLLPLEES